MVRSARRGFTLIELLVVIAIIAILMGLLMPAVQKVREAAARTQCLNNLKQIGLAIHNHHDNYGYFPPGGTQPSGGSTSDPNDRTQWNWQYHLLPFLEQQNLHDNSDYNVVDTMPVKLFYCEVRRRAQNYNGSARCDYAANAGTEYNTAKDGVIIWTDKGKLSFASITDGTSNTVMVAERQMNNKAFGTATDDNEPYNRAAWNGDWDAYRIGVEPPARDIPTGDTHSIFGSAHSSGLNVLFADGGVRHIRYGVTQQQWQAACTRNGGEVATLD